MIVEEAAKEETEAKLKISELETNLDSKEKEKIAFKDSTSSLTTEIGQLKSKINVPPPILTLRKKRLSSRSTSRPKKSSILSTKTI